MEVVDIHRVVSWYASSIVTAYRMYQTGTQKTHDSFTYPRLFSRGTHTICGVSVEIHVD